MQSSLLIAARPLRHIRNSMKVCQCDLAISLGANRCRAGNWWTVLAVLKCRGVLPPFTTCARIRYARQSGHLLSPRSSVRTTPLYRRHNSDRSANTQCHRSPASHAVKGNGSRAGVLKLILYSKPDCHLCHGLKEKIDVALSKARFLPSELSDAEIEVRDITTNPQWERRYGLSIPILTVVAPGSEEEVKVRRVPPRSSSDRVARHILAAVTGDEDILEGP